MKIIRVIEWEEPTTSIGIGLKNRNNNLHTILILYMDLTQGKESIHIYQIK